ncbi:hypothetical protein AM10699_46710 [Acaryochloris marina MBIC10699]|nr:hypothetical protein AM10699_46710 [Acaryochloris marina MBIC10699]
MKTNKAVAIAPKSLTGIGINLYLIWAFINFTIPFLLNLFGKIYQYLLEQHGWSCLSTLPYTGHNWNDDDSYEGLVLMEADPSTKV